MYPLPPILLPLCMIKQRTAKVAVEENKGEPAPTGIVAAASADESKGEPASAGSDSAAPAGPSSLSSREQDATPQYLCPITKCPMENPAVASDGYTYERWVLPQNMDRTLVNVAEVGEKKRYARPDDRHMVSEQRYRELPHATRTAACSFCTRSLTTLHLLYFRAMTRHLKEKRLKKKQQQQ